jgi:farnesyl diphosphate synthase
VASAHSSGFDGFLTEAAAQTDALLDSVLAVEGSAAPRLVEAMRYASLGAGKRLRPFFVLASARLFAVPRPSALRVGAALECVHCYSLVHDDLPAMDDDDLRRGKPTVHKQFDEATAILAGDSLLTLAFEIMADPATHDDGAVRAALCLELARAAGKEGMAGGQMLDLEAEKIGVMPLDAVRRMQALKTGALFRFACEAGAILGGAPRNHLRQYAEHVGLAFQIADDILDAESSPEQLGKATQKDRGRGKASYVASLGLDGAKAKARSLAEEAIAALAPYGTRAALLHDAARFIVSRRK